MLVADDGTVFHYDNKRTELIAFVESIEDSSNQTEIAYIVCDDTELVYGILKSYYDYIEAAGGLVLNSNGAILWIKRLGKWDLPKGKVEVGEQVEVAAIREVEEETGIYNPSIEKELLSTFHTYIFKGKRVLKKTYWFLMKYDGDIDLVPQLEEDITEACWLLDPVNPMSNTYENIKDVVNVSKLY